MKMIPVLAAVVAGFACGFAADRLLVARAPEPAPQVVTDPAATNELAKAEKQIAELEKQLASVRSGLKKAKSEAAQAKEETAELVKAEAEKTENDGAVIVAKDGNVDLMDELKKRLPADQFEKVQDAFAQMRAKLNKRAKSRQDFLASIDTTRMTEKERETHKRYLELFAKREEMSQKMRGGQFNPQTLQEMAVLSQEMGPVAKEERATLMRQVAGELGYQGEDAEVITETVKNIYDCTNGGPLGGLSDMLEGVGGGAQPNISVQTHVIAP